MKKTGRPLVPSLNDNAGSALLDAGTYQEVAGHLDAVAGIRLGLVQAGKGAGRLADKVFDDLEREDSTR